MRRMYSEQELTNVIKKVFEEELESGALDELVSDAVDAYLVEHPVDVTALEGQDVELNSLDATGLITGGELIEKMSGYSFAPNTSELSDDGVTLSYVGVVKTGNKITFVIAGTFSPTTGVPAHLNPQLGDFTIPQSVYDKLYPDSNGVIDNQTLNFSDTASSYVSKTFTCQKHTNNRVRYNLRNMSSGFEDDKTYSFRISSTFLLSENLISE